MKKLVLLLFLILAVMQTATAQTLESKKRKPYRITKKDFAKNNGGIDFSKTV